MSGPIGPGSPIGPHLNPTNPPVPTTPAAVPIQPGTPIGPALDPAIQPHFETSVALDIITAKWNALNGAPGPAVTPGFDGIKAGNRCFFQNFAHGAIYRVGKEAFWVHGPIFERYNAIGASRGPLGRPRTDVMPAQHDQARRVMFFEQGRMYFTPAFEAIGAIELVEPQLSHWIHKGGEKSYLGYPTTAMRDDLTANFENGTIHLQDEFVFDAADARIIKTGPIHVDGAAASANANLTISASGSWEYEGVMRTSGVLSHDVVINTALDFRTANGKVFAWGEKGDVEGTFVLGGDREHRFHQFGMNRDLKANWPAIKTARATTNFTVETGAGDVLAVIGTVVGLPVAAIALLVAGAFLADNTKMCGLMERERFDPATQDFARTQGFVVVGKDEPCPEGTVPP